jgi:hypothetical protein
MHLLALLFALFQVEKVHLSRAEVQALTEEDSNATTPVDLFAPPFAAPGLARATAGSLKD